MVIGLISLAASAFGAFTDSQQFFFSYLFGWLFWRTARDSEERQALMELAEARGLDVDERRVARAVAAGRGAELRLRLEDERAQGRAILISSHVMSFVERVSDRIGVMRAGKLVAEGSPAELRELTDMADSPLVKATTSDTSQEFKTKSTIAASTSAGT